MHAHRHVTRLSLAEWQHLLPGESKAWSFKSQKLLDSHSSRDTHGADSQYEGHTADFLSLKGSFRRHRASSTRGSCTRCPPQTTVTPWLEHLPTADMFKNSVIFNPSYPIFFPVAHFRKRPFQRNLIACVSLCCGACRSPGDPIIRPSRLGHFTAQGAVLFK